MEPVRVEAEQALSALKKRGMWLVRWRVYCWKKGQLCCQITRNYCMVVEVLRQAI